MVCAGVDVEPAYLVVVRPNEKKVGEILVVDINKDEILYKGSNYEDVYNWLSEDEFELVKGRVF